MDDKVPLKEATILTLDDEYIHKFTFSSQFLHSILKYTIYIRIRLTPSFNIHITEETRTSWINAAVKNVNLPLCVHSLYQHYLFMSCIYTCLLGLAWAWRGGVGAVYKGWRDGMASAYRVCCM